MRKHWILYLLCAVILALVLGTRPVTAHPNAAPTPQPDTKKIEPSLLDTLQASGAADFDVVLTEQADLSAAYSMTDWDARGDYVYQTLLETATRTQKPLLDYLQAQGLKYQSFIAGNEVIVYGGTMNAASAISTMPAVGAIQPTHTITLDDPEYKIDGTGLVRFGLQPWSQNIIKGSWSIPTLQTVMNAGSSGNSSLGVQTAVIDWGITDTKADQAWSLYNDRGEGVVVADVDTGVQWDHPALIGSYKCGNSPNNPICWNDPTQECGSAGACDKMGHGTHTMGTMVASDDPSLAYTAGMAPHARWIACKAFIGNSGSQAWLNACADWILAPAGNPSNRPNIVNNSWGNVASGGDTWFLSKVQAWRASGIFPAFAAGNSGPGCNTLRSPGDYQQSFSSAAHDSTRTIADFSSRGSSAFGDDPYTKPNLSAPGVNIWSAWPGSQWNSDNGTSMASPHTAGAVALLWTCDPSLVGQIDQTFQLLQNNTDPRIYDGNCLPPANGQGNYTYGYGYLDVLKAMQADSKCHANGTLKGQVTSGGNPLPGVEVKIVNSSNSRFQWTTTTDASGNYSQVLPYNTYNIYYTKYGYVSDSYLGTAVYAGGITTRNIALTVANVITLDGYVTDKASGLPLAANILFATSQFSDTVTSNPMNGYYILSLNAQTSYHIQVVAVDPGYREQNFLSQTFDYTTSRDFALEADPISCSAPGYRNAYTYYKDFEINNGSFTSGGTNPSWAWGAPTSGPGRARSGQRAWATNLNGSYNNNETSYLDSPNINLSSLSGNGLYLDWWQWVNVEKNADSITVYVSKNGGTNWTNVYTFSDIDASWKPQRLYLDSSFAVSSFKVRFLMKSNGTNTFPGWYIDDIGIGTVSTLNESFEGVSFPPAGWGVYDNDRDAKTWTISTDHPYTTTHNVAAGPNCFSHGFCLIQDDWLVSPDIYMTSSGSQTLYFYDYTAIVGSEYHTLGYCDEASPGGCGSPPFNYSLFSGFWPAQSSWTLRSFGFPATQNHVMRVAWNYYHDSGSGGTWYIDSVRLQNGYVLDSCWAAPAGPLTFTPPSLQASLNLGGATASQSLQIGNTGVSASGFYISEYNLGFTPALASQALHLPGVKPAAPSPADKTDALTPAQSLSPQSFTPVDQPQAAGSKPSTQVSPDIARRITSVPAYALAWKSSYNYALYSFDTATPGTWTEVGDFGNLFLTGAEFVGQDTSQFYALGVYNNHLYSVNTSTATPTDLGLIPPLTGHYWGGMTSGPDGKLYASSSDCHNSEIYTVDLASHSATPLFTVTNAPCLDSIAMNALGQMVGMDVKIDSLVRIDMSSGEGTVIGPLGYNASFNQEMAFDWMSGALYWAAFNNVASELRLIDTTTGASARIDAFPGPTWVTAFLLPGSISSDVPWLSEVPISGTLSAGGNKTVNVTFTSPSVANQPGTYLAQLRIGNDSLVGTGVVTATLEATIPDSWGYLHGVVSGLGPCDTPGGPLPYALVQIYDMNDKPVGTTQTDANGVYNYALLSGSYKVKASLLTYLPFETGGVAVPAGQQMLSQDFTLRRNLPCFTATPTSLTGNVFAGNTLTLTLTISNTGGGNGSALSLKHGGSQTSTNLIQDPSFELYTSPSSPWQQYSANFPTPLWTYPSGNAKPNSGDVFAWFGGYDRDIEEAYISQTVTLPVGSSAGLVFWLALPQCANAASDYMVVTIDGNQIFKIDATSSLCGDSTYYPQMIDITSYADGNKHSLEFYSYTSGGGISDFLVDDVSIEDPDWGKVLWLTTSPAYVTLPAGTNKAFKVVFSPGSNTPGSYAAMLTLDGAPNTDLNVPTSMVIGAPPDNLTAAAASQTEIDLRWRDNSSNERGFMIERSPDGVSGWKVIDRVGVNVRDYQDKSAACGSTYYYRVRAFTAGGFSAYTNLAHDTTLVCSPAAPTNLTASTTITDHINLHWTDNSGNETGFQVEWSPDGATGWAALTTVGQNIQDYPDAGLSCGVDRYYRVRAYNTGGSSSYTNAAHGSTLPCPLAAPTGLTVTAVSQTWVSLSWTSHSSNEDGFKIERSPDGQNGWQVVGTVGPGVTLFSDPGLSPGKDYYYRVYAYKGGLNSPTSNIVHAVTKMSGVWLPLISR